MRFVDSNIIAYAFYDNEWREACQQVLRDGGLTNMIALVEAYNIIEMEESRERATRAIRGILKSALHVVDIDQKIIFEALKKTERVKKLKFLDLVHYTTASLYSCQAIITVDKDFDCLDIPRDEP
jgi:predicted nucleic acid-binding protein